MAKIKIKVLGGPLPRKRDLLANALYGAEIRVLRYIAIQDGYLALIDNDIQAEKLFSKDVVLSLEKLGFSPVLPVDMKAKLTLVFKKLDRQVVNESPLDIEDEITAAFPEAQVDNIFVMKANHIIKVRFTDHATAKAIKEKGMYLFKLYVAPWQIEFERYTPIRQCMNCFGYGHLKNHCKEEKRTRCTECGSSTHSFRDCRSQVKKCLNCGGAHRTFANSCPMRKEAMKTSQEKSKEKEKEKETRPIRAVAQKAAQETVQATTNAWKPLINQVRQDIKQKTPDPTIHLALPDNLSKEILVVLLHAHLQNLIAPEKGFRHHAKAALANNNLPDLDLGDSNSWGILKVIEPPTMTIQAPPEPQPQRPQPPQVQAPPQPQRPQPSQVQAPQPQPQRPQTVRVQVQEPQPAQMSEPQPAEAQTAAPQSSPQESSPTSAPPTTGPSVRPKYIHIPSEAETRDILSDTPLDTPGPPPPTPDQTEPGHSHVDDEGMERLMDGTATDPTYYGIRLFAENPKKYEYSDRYEIGQEIINKRIKWLLTKEEHAIVVTIKKLHHHLKEGNLQVTNEMIERCDNMHSIHNGYLIE